MILLFAVLVRAFILLLFGFPFLCFQRFILFFVDIVDVFHRSAAVIIRGTEFSVSSPRDAASWGHCSL